MLRLVTVVFVHQTFGATPLAPDGEATRLAQLFLENLTNRLVQGVNNRAVRTFRVLRGASAIITILKIVFGFNSARVFRIMFRVTQLRKLKGCNVRHLSPVSNTC